MTPQAQWIRPPRQLRSQQTLERILAAAEAVISEKGIDNTTVVEVARRADSSVGALYARFGDKEALLRSVFDRFYEQMVATAAHVFDPRRSAEVSIPELFNAAITLMLRIFRERGRLIAGFTIRAAKSPDLSAVGERLGLEVAGRAHAFLEQRGAPIAHPNPALAVSFAVMMILSALEARTLYSVRTLELVPEEDVATELTRMCLAYLGLPMGVYEHEYGYEHDREHADVEDGGSP